MSAVTSYVKTTRKALVDEVLASIKSGEPLFWSNKMNMIGRNCNANTQKPYRGVNMLYLFVANMKHEKETGSFYKDNRWMTFKQIQDKEYHLKRGAKACPVEFFEMKKYDIDKYISYLESNNYPSKAIENAKELKSQGATEIIKPIVKVYKVFNGEDIEGLTPIDQLTNKDLETKHQEMEAMIKNSEAKIEYLGHRPDPDFSNYYSPGHDSIMLANPEYFQDMAGFYATAAHEIGHSTGHQDRLSRSGITKINNFGSPEYAKEELRAELVSMFIGQDYGIGIDDQHKNNHKAYFQGWIKALENDPDELVKAATEAEKAVDYIKEHMINRTKEMEYYLSVREIANQMNTLKNTKQESTWKELDNKLTLCLDYHNGNPNEFGTILLTDKETHQFNSIEIHNKSNDKFIFKAIQNPETKNYHFGYTYDFVKQQQQQNTRARKPGQGLEPKTQSQTRDNSLQM